MLKGEENVFFFFFFDKILPQFIQNSKRIYIKYQLSMWT